MRLSSKQFTYDAAKRTFAAEISDFGKNFHFERVYQDACDVGFVMVSERTGKEAAFAVYEEATSEGEVTHWVLVPTPEAIRKQRQLAGTKVLIFND